MNYTWNSLQINILLDQTDYDKIVAGYDFGTNMDHKWRIIFENNWLTFNRSWANDPIYKLYIRKLGNNYITDQAQTTHDLDSVDIHKSFKEVNNYHLLFIGALLESHIFNPDSIAFDILSNSKFLVLSKLNLNSIHGINHWRKVEKIGKYLAEKNGADLELITAFAYLHDWGRINDETDPEHGIRSVEIINELRDRLEITDNQLEKLKYAIEHHSNGSAESDNITIQTCWDSDRLDLWRIGITPDPKYLSTGQAKMNETLDYSRYLNHQF